MVDWSLLISPTFWFAIRWNPLQIRTALLMGAVFGLFVLCGLFLPRVVTRGRSAPKFEQKAWHGVARPFWLSGLLGLLFTFLSYQQIPIFSARFWFLLIGVYFVIALVLAVRYYQHEMAELLEAEKGEAANNRYFS